MSRTKRITAIALAILAFFIFVGSPFQQPASAIALEGSVIAIIIAALAALGITVTASGAFGDVETYVEELLQEYADSRQIPYSALFTGLEAGSNSLGKLIINNRFVVMISGFASWLISKFSLTDNRIVNVNPSFTLSGVTLFKTGVHYVLHDNVTNREFILVGYVQMPSMEDVDDVYYFFSKDGDNYQMSLVSQTYYQRGSMSTTFYDSSFNVVGYSSVGTGVSNRRGLLYYSNPGGNMDFWPEGLVPFVGNFDALKVWEEGANFEESSDLRIQTGTIVLPEDDPGYSDGDAAVIDVDASWGMDYGEITDGVLPETYEDSSIEYKGEEEAAQEVTDTPSQTVSQDVNDYQTPGLPDVFPFCIPFDIYAFFECLAADPVAPSFTWRFYVPGICDEEIELDLSEFDSVAQIVRTMELLAFIVGLALVTRNRFLRG